MKNFEHRSAGLADAYGFAVAAAYEPNRCEPSIEEAIKDLKLASTSNEPKRTRLISNASIRLLRLLKRQHLTTVPGERSAG